MGMTNIDTADSIYYDNTLSLLVKDNVKEAIDEVNNKVVAISTEIDCGGPAD